MGVVRASSIQGYAVPLFVIQLMLLVCVFVKSAA